MGSHLCLAPVTLPGTMDSRLGDGSRFLAREVVAESRGECEPRTRLWLSGAGGGKPGNLSIYKSLNDVSMGKSSCKMDSNLFQPDTQPQSARALPIIFFDSGLPAEWFVSKPYDMMPECSIYPSIGMAPVLVFSIHQTGGYRHNPMQATDLLSSSHQVVPQIVRCCCQAVIPCVMVWCLTEIIMSMMIIQLKVFVTSITSRGKQIGYFHYASSRMLLCFAPAGVAVSAL